MLIVCRRVSRLKAVYDQLMHWSVDMQNAVTREAHCCGLAVVASIALRQQTLHHVVSLVNLI